MLFCRNQNKDILDNIDPNEDVLEDLVLNPTESTVHDDRDVGYNTDVCDDMDLDDDDYIDEEDMTEEVLEETEKPEPPPKPPDFTRPKKGDLIIYLEKESFFWPASSLSHAKEIAECIKLDLNS